ncbi:MAG: hypothetical protein AAFO95_04510 [Cyanobacteria bacterium J06600_6]
MGEDFLVLLLAFTFLSSHLLQNAIGLFLLQISFWCIYEIGYIENDIIGEKFEDKAVLSYNYNSYHYSFQLWQPWVWAAILSALGIAILSQDLAIEGANISSELFNQYDFQYSFQMFQISRGLIYWFSFLLALRFLFHIYNHINKQSRVWFYLLLQSCRYCGYLVLLTTNTVGLVLLVSKVIIRSVQYVLYRYMGGKGSDWPMSFPRYFFYLLIYLFILGAIALNERNIALVFNYQVLAIIGFCLIRGAKHFQKVFFQLNHVRKDSSNRVI